MRARHPVLIAGAFIIFGSISLACEYSAIIWSPGGSADALYRFVQDGKAGYIDRTGKVVISPRFDDSRLNILDEFHNGLLDVFSRSRFQGDDLPRIPVYGYVNTKGDAAFNNEFESASRFSEGLAVVQLKRDQGYGYIDTTGQLVIPPKFEDAGSFSDGLALVLAGERTGYIDKQGKFALEPRYFRGRDFHQGRAWVVIDAPCRWQQFFDENGSVVDGIKLLGNSCFGSYTLPASKETSPDVSAVCGYALIDKSGRVLSQNRFVDVGDFSEGLSPVRIGRLWGYADRNGVVVIEPKFDLALGFSGGLAAVGMKRSGSADFLYGFIDRSGALVLQHQFEYAEKFSEGLAAVRTGNKFWFIDRRGRRVIDATFEAAGSFFKGLAHVKVAPGNPDYRNSGTFAYINTSGKAVFTYRRQED